MVMHIRLRIFASKPEREPAGGERYVSHLQRDIRKYEGWTRDMVDADYKASKTVHTMLTIGYMEYADDTLVLTDRGRLVMRRMDRMPLPSERGPFAEGSRHPSARAMHAREARFGSQ